MKDTLKNIAGTALKWGRRFSELLTLIIAVYLLAGFNGWVYAIDPTAAPLDAGVLSIILLGVVAVLAAPPLAWITLFFSFPKAYRYLDNQLENDLLHYKHDTSCHHQTKMFLALFACYYLASVVLLTAALLSL